MVKARLAALLLVVLLAVPLAQDRAAAAPRPSAPPAPGIAELLRYVGRDQSTGLPVPVNDRFIAASERAIERYGKDAGQAVPPPPVSGTDIARVAIPRLGVDAPVARFGLDRYGRLDVPLEGRTVAWHPAYSSLPGEDGATFLAAHFEYAGVPGVFNRLGTMQPGDDVLVALTDGSSRLYRVTSVVDYALAAIDMGAILRGREGVESLTLMTCSGPANEGEYAFRTVVLAARAAP